MCLVSTALLTAPALRAGFVWDDNPLITRNPELGAPLLEVAQQPFFPAAARAANPAPAYYRPIPKLALALVARGFGLEAWAFHALNWALNLACVGLCMDWLERRMRAPQAPAARAHGPARVALVALAGLVYALHPARAQVIGWISGGCDLWMTLFMLAGACFWQRRAEQPSAAPLAGVACALAYLSKEPAVVLPVLLLVDCWLRAERPRLQHAAWLLGGTLLAHGLRLSMIDTPWASPLANGGGPLLTRVCVSLGFALQASAWPFDPRFQLNPPSASLAELAPSELRMFLLGALCVLLLAWLSWAALRRPRLRVWLADAVWYLLPLAPSLNLLPIGAGSTLSERYLYCPLLGVSALLLRALAPLRMPSIRPWLVAAPWLAACALVGVQELQHLRSERALLEHFLEQDPTELTMVDALLELRLRDHDLAGVYALAAHRLSVVMDFRESAQDHDQAQANRLSALIKHVRLELMLLSDLEQTRLLQLRAFHDALADPDAAQAQLQVGSRSYRLALDAGVRSGLRDPSTRTAATEDRIMLHARTLDLEVAERLARAYVAAEPHSTRARLTWIRNLAWNLRWDDARAALESVGAEHLPGPWPHFASLLQRSAALAATELGTPSRKALALARLIADWGLPAQAHAWLQAWSKQVGADAPETDRAAAFELEHTRLYVLLADARFDLARAALQSLLQRWPEQRAAIASDQLQLATALQRAPVRRSGLPQLSDALLATIAHGKR